MKYFLVILILALFSANPVLAGYFVTSADSMVEQLSATPAPAPPKVLLRNFPGSSSPPAQIPEVRTRSIDMLLKHNNGQIVEQTVLVTDQQLKAHVNLKVEFDVNSATIRANSYQLLAELGKAVDNERLAGKVFAINGHTDSDGDSR